MSLNKRINALEPLWWALFGIGGAVSAFLYPAHIFSQMFVPMNFDHMHSLLQSPLVKIYVFILIMFPLFHAAHRIRLTLEDLRSEGLNQIAPLLCYGGALVLTIVAAAELICLS